MDGEHLTWQVREAKSNAKGWIDLKIPISENDRSVLLTVIPESGHQAYIQQWSDSHANIVFDAEEHWEQPRYKTNAVVPSSAVSFNWPVVSSDVALEEGRWPLTIGVLDSRLRYAKGVNAKIHVLTSPFDPEDATVLKVALWVSQAIADDEHWLSSSVEAVEVWADLLAQWGLTLQVRWEILEVDEIGIPGLADGASYEDLSALSEAGEMTVLLVSEITGLSSIFGIAGGIPGALVPADNAAVVVSLTENAGPDLLFSEQEVRLMGETFAHEVLHYTGIFHPVEITWDRWDVVTDTPECATASSCTELFVDNLMFPYPVCAGGVCTPQFVMTQGQQAINRRYVGMRSP